MSEIVSASSASGTNVLNTVFKAIKFIFVSYIISVILLAILAVIIVYTDVSEGIASPAVKIITVFGAFLSALLTSKSAEAKGWLCGIITGGLNVFMLLVLGMAIMGSKVFTVPNMSLVACGAVCGLVGGVIGVNFGSN